MYEGKWKISSQKPTHGMTTEALKVGLTQFQHICVTKTERIVTERCHVNTTLFASLFPTMGRGQILSPMQGRRCNTLKGGRNFI